MESNKEEFDLSQFMHEIIPNIYSVIACRKNEIANFETYLKFKIEDKDSQDIFLKNGKKASRFLQNFFEGYQKAVDDAGLTLPDSLKNGMKAIGDAYTQSQKLWQEREKRVMAELKRGPLRVSQKDSSQNAPEKHKTQDLVPPVQQQQNLTDLKAQNLPEESWKEKEEEHKQDKSPNKQERKMSNFSRTVQEHNAPTQEKQVIGGHTKKVVQDEKLSREKPCCPIF